MADDQAPDTATNADATQRQFAIQKVYLRDVSFENPNSPQVYSGDGWEPKMDLRLESSSRRIGTDQYEVVLKLSIETKSGERTAYLIEVQQAGVFVLRGFPEAELGHVLGSYCPGILFPFAREEIASLASKGGFPQLLLDPINFDAIYAQQLQQQGGAPATANA